MDLNKVGYRDVSWLQLPQHRFQLGVGGCNELSVAIKGKDFLKQNVCKLFGKVIAPLTYNPITKRLIQLVIKEKCRLTCCRCVYTRGVLKGCH
jgi:hypothetical protein